MWYFITMKIGIVTTTFPNYGSKLQNLATVELLRQKYPKCKTDTIILSTPNKCFGLLYLLSKLGIYSLFYKLIKFRGKINANNKMLHYKIYVVKEINNEHISFLDKKYDLFVFGSDQIWNFTEKTADFKFGLFTDKKICNAPSLIVNEGLDVAKLRDNLSTFNQLNVREKETSDFIKKELNIECSVMSDPTLRLPSEHWQNLIKYTHCHNKDFVLLYILNDKDLFDSLSEKYKGLNVVRIFQQNNGENTKFNFTPIEFVKIVSLSKKVITNSFHGCCFASIFKKNLQIIQNNNKSDCRFDAFRNYEKLFVGK